MEALGREVLHGLLSRYPAEGESPEQLPKSVRSYFLSSVAEKHCAKVPSFNIRYYGNDSVVKDIQEQGSPPTSESTRAKPHQSLSTKSQFTCVAHTKDKTSEEAPVQQTPSPSLDNVNINGRPMSVASLKTPSRALSTTVADKASTPSARASSSPLLTRRSRFNNASTQPTLVSSGSLLLRSSASICPPRQTNRAKSYIASKAEGSSTSLPGENNVRIKLVRQVENPPLNRSTATTTTKEQRSKPATPASSSSFLMQQAHSQRRHKMKPLKNRDFGSIPESLALNPALSQDTVGTLDLTLSASSDDVDYGDDISVAASVLSTASITSALTVGTKPSVITIGEGQVSSLNDALCRLNIGRENAIEDDDSASVQTISSRRQELKRLRSLAISVTNNNGKKKNPNEERMPCGSGSNARKNTTELETRPTSTPPPHPTRCAVAQRELLKQSPPRPKPMARPSNESRDYSASSLKRAERRRRRSLPRGPSHQSSPTPHQPLSPTSQAMAIHSTRTAISMLKSGRRRRSSSMSRN